MGNTSPSSPQIISLPKGGGALRSMGEKFAPDLHTGTGNFTVPIALPPGRNGFQPQVNIVYSTGQGNGPFGLGWDFGIPGVARKTSKGTPRFDHRDVFILSGAEDLVPIEQDGVRTRFRPRTEGLFARIDRHQDIAHGIDFWEVRSRDGMVSTYGKPRPALAPPGWHDPAALFNPELGKAHQIFAWKLTQTRDPFGNKIVYEYEADLIDDGHRRWHQLYLKRIRYVDFNDEDGSEHFLVSITFDYGDLATERPDAFSDYRAGFEIRTRRRCQQIIVRTHADQERLVRSYRLDYANDAANGVSLLRAVRVVGHGDDGVTSEELPPLEFGYTHFDPDRRDFFPIQGPDMPGRSLADPDLALIDLSGDGLPDILEMNGSVRYWRNLGEGAFDLPRAMRDAPAGLTLAESGVQLIDANGDGRTDLLVTANGTSGYFPLRFDGRWDRRSFRRFAAAPSFNLEDPEVRLVDLNGDGVTDAIRAGERLECFFNDPQAGWAETRRVERRAFDTFPDVTFSDPRVRWADMTGDGLQDILLVHDGNVDYWPSLGRGNWAGRIAMRNSPRFPYGYDPRRILVGDVDGDGLADIVYVDDRQVTLWINRSGNGWSDPLTIEGTPPVTDQDAVQLADIRGSGIGGVLWSADPNGLPRSAWCFLDFTGGTKPYLLDEMDNHMGAVTRVKYAPSTRYYREDARRRETRWKTPLPFPVQVVTRVEVIDGISGGKLTTEFAYHHGYWDGAEREFRGFGRVDQRDTEVFADYHAAGAHPDDRPFEVVSVKQFSPPIETRTWFHQGPVGDEFGECEETDLGDESWSGDPNVLPRPPDTTSLLKSLPRRARRDALRALRGRVLRTELYALDGTARQHCPYTVTEHLSGVREVSPPSPDHADRERIFFAFALAERTTQWERGSDAMIRFAFTSDYDAYGMPRSQTSIAVPRRRDFRMTLLQNQPAPESYLATHTVIEHAQADDATRYIVDRAARTTTFEVANDGRPTLFALQTDIEQGLFDTPDNAIGQTLNYYDGETFTGLPLGMLGDHGALVRTETLVLTEAILEKAYGPELPPYPAPDGEPAWTAEYPLEFRELLPRDAGYVFRSGGPGHRDLRGFFVATSCGFDFQLPGVAPRGLVTITRDSLGHDTQVAHDRFDVLPAAVVDAAGLTTEVTYDYRVLQPEEVTDANGDRTVFTFTPAGLLATTAVLGKSGEGDTLDVPGVRRSYDFHAFDTTGQPVSVATVLRAHHVSELEVDLAGRERTIRAVEYSDGFGRLIQTRTQAEDLRFGDPHFGDSGLLADQTVPASVAAGHLADEVFPPVVVSGWQRYDNKGRVVEKHEPFFAAGWAYALPASGELGQNVTLSYDPRGQLACTVYPDGSEQRVVFGIPLDLTEPDLYEPTPWETFTYDANDNAGRTHPAALDYRHHWDTPASAVLDALGRTVEIIERNRGPGAPMPPIAEYRTGSSYDIRGNLLTVVDALDRVAVRHVYDLANNPLCMESIDAGLRRRVLDAAGNVIEQRDGRGAVVLQTLDRLHRPTRRWARDDATRPVTLRERLEYGDGGDPQQPAPERQTGRLANRLGRLHRHFDEAGLIIVDGYDFKGNVTEKVRRVIRDTAILAAFDPPPPDWQVHAFRVDWQPPPGRTLDEHAEELLDAAGYRTSLAYDALNRVTQMRYPQDVDSARQVLRPRYNRAGALEFVALNGDAFVEHIAYNAKGQRILIAFGNGVMTRHAYDAKTFRLLRLRTERYTKPDALTYQPTGTPLQDLAFEFDLAGNILRLTERTPGCGVINTPEGMEALTRLFTYDPLYRLLSASGRECKETPAPRPWTDDPRCGFNSGNHGTLDQESAPHLTTLYHEEYAYDPTGNMVSLKHGANGASWVRHFGMGGLTPQQWSQEWPSHLAATTTWVDPPGNALTHVGDDEPGVLQTHFYDANGNLIRETTSRHFEWDHADRLRVYRTQAGNAEPSVHAHYLYDAGGQRVKKLVRKQGGRVEVTVSIDAIFEHHRIVRPGATAENNTLHVMDNQSRIALIRVGSPFPEDATPAVKFHFGDHLGSSAIVIGEGGDWINREEFTPYGETSLGSFARKRYRFTGKERDEESGLYYHGARYYAPWLARWTATDPARQTDGKSPCMYVDANPLRLTDPDGRNAEELFNRAAQYTQEVAAIREELTNLRQGIAAESEAYNRALVQYNSSGKTDMAAVAKMESARRSLEFHQSELEKLGQRAAILNTNVTAPKSGWAKVWDFVRRKPRDPGVILNEVPGISNITRGQVLAGELEIENELASGSATRSKRMDKTMKVAKKLGNIVQQADKMLGGVLKELPRVKQTVATAIKSAAGLVAITMRGIKGGGGPKGGAGPPAGAGPQGRSGGGVGGTAAKSATVLFLWDLARAETPEDTHQVLFNTVMAPVIGPLLLLGMAMQPPAPSPSAEDMRREAEIRRQTNQGGGEGAGPY